ncbi:MAG: DUF4153 domain-containing protein [Stackebrandtia sp.]
MSTMHTPDEPVSPPREIAPPLPATAHRPRTAPFAWPRQFDIGGWWIGVESGAPALLLLPGMAVAILGAISLVNTDGIGLGLSVAGIGSVLLPLAHGGSRQLATRLAGAALVSALWSVAAVRDAGWVVGLCAAAAVVLTVAALVPPRRFTGMFLATVGAPLGLLGATLWTARGFKRLFDRPGGVNTRSLGTVGVTVLLLVVFGGLFAAADVTFARLLSTFVPEMRVDIAVGRLLTAMVLFAAVCLCGYVAVTRPRFDAADVPAAKPVSRLEWTIPLGVLNALFAVFVAVQARAFFGGDAYVKETSGLTYAEYARSGFWQLSAVAALTMLVIAIAAWKAPRATRADRLLLRLLLGALCVLSLVVVASALHRMNLYSQAYGLTRLRVWVFAVELWFAAIFVFVLACGWRLRASWLPRAVAATGAAVLLGLASTNPDVLIAEQNIARAETTGRLDLDYLSTLSADAAPALSTLPAEDRDYVFCRMSDFDADGPLSWNLGRALAADAPSDPATCDWD